MSAERIEWLLGRLRESADPATFLLVEELVRHLLAVHGAGLARVLALASEAGAASEHLARACADDLLVSALLALHGLHPRDLRERVEAALERVRPQLALHAGAVTLAGIDERRTVRIKLAGSCEGCASSRATLRQLIEQAVLEAAPEVTGVELDGVTPPADEAKLITLSRRAS